MKKYLLALLLLLCFGAFNLFAQPSGSGTAADPYIIDEEIELIYTMNQSSLWGAGIYIELGADLDMDNTSYSPSPIGNAYNYYRGNFDGKDYTISNITISTPSPPNSSHVGFFGYVEDARIKNLHLRNVDISGQYNTAGMCGYNEGGSFNNCSVTGNVEGLGSGGGFVGGSDGGEYKKCYSECEVNTSGNNSFGGFVGIDHSGEYQYCYSTGNVDGVNNVGGFIGTCPSANTSITNCYCTGNVEGYNYIGSFIGYNKGYIKYCYASGQINLLSGVSYPNIGGFVGWSTANQDNYECCYWDNDKNSGYNDSGSPSSDRDNIFGISTSDFADPSTFAGCFNIEEGTTWIMSNGYPVLTVFTIPTLTEWAAISFISLLAIVGGLFIWRKMA